MRILFYDIETSPNIGLFWRAGYKVNITADSIIKERAIICLSYSWSDSDKVKRLTWVKGDDKPLVEKFIKIISKADLLVAHYGDRFDIKWIRTRALYHGLTVPDVKSIDTCVQAKALHYFNSNTLRYLAEYLGHKDLPKKYAVPYEVWKRITLAGLLLNKFDRQYYADMAQMGVYCDQDVTVLKWVYYKLAPTINPRTHAGRILSGSKASCPRCGGVSSFHKRFTTVAGTYRYQLRCNNCRGFHTVSEKVFNENF
jgi:hypothetical protein